MSVEDAGELKVMVPFHIHILRKILDQPHGKPAALLFLYLLATSRLHRHKEPGGWISVSGIKTAGLYLSAASRVRGLRALEDLGLVQLRQDGNHAYRAKLLYDARALDGEPVLPDGDVELPDDFTEQAVRQLLRAAGDEGRR
jgi:hypothetical protein